MELCQRCVEPAIANVLSRANRIFFVRLQAASLLAGYRPSSDVEQHSFIDLDIKYIVETCMGDVEDVASNDGAVSWDICARNIYEKGQNSFKNATALRTIQGFSTAAEEKFGPLAYSDTGQNFSVARRAATYFGSWTYGDEFNKAALDGSGVWSGLSSDRWAGPSGRAANIVLARQQALAKGMVHHNVLMYSLYESFKQIWRAQNEVNLTTVDLEEELAHGWDEGRAFWVGSSEDSPFGPWALSEKRAPSFGTDRAPALVKGGGSSLVSFKMLGASQVGRNSLYLSDGTRHRVAAVEAAYSCIESQAFVPLIQGCLLYTFKAEICDPELEDCGEIYGEAYAFCSVVLPLLNAVDPGAATVVAVNSDPTSDAAVKLGYNATRTAIYRNLNTMGLLCADIGACIECGDQGTDFAASWCADGSNVDHCALTWPMDESSAPSSCISTSSSGTDWKFIAILLLCVVGSAGVAVLLSLLSGWCDRKGSVGGSKDKGTPGDEETKENTNGEGGDEPWPAVETPVGREPAV